MASLILPDDVHARDYCGSLVNVMTAHAFLVRKFSNFESATVKQSDKLIRALDTLEELIGNPVFATRVGETFRYDQIEPAMTFESAEGAKAVWVA